MKCTGMRFEHLYPFSVIFDKINSIKIVTIQNLIDTSYSFSTIQRY